MPARETPVTRLERARQVLETEANAILALVPTLGRPFEDAVEMLLACRGHVVVSGLGKAGLIGAKISATMASTGTPSHFMHPAEAFHGDLGRLRDGDVALLISNSGETGEVVRLIDPLRRLGIRILALTGAGTSALARGADLVLDVGRAAEACPLGLAPSTSTTVLLALGDALALALVDARQFSREDYARFHPGGLLGRQLLRVDEIMRRGDGITVMPEAASVREVLIAINSTRGRPGAAMLVNAAGALSGFLTDGDLARRLQEGTSFLAEPASSIMTRSPQSVRADELVSKAWHLLQTRHIDQLPVVDVNNHPIGLVDVQDVLSARTL